MTRPSKSRFMGWVYEIEFLPPGQVKTDDDHDAWGTTDHNECRIRVEDNLHPDRERATVLHETIHQVLNLVGAQLPEEIEERVCTILGEALIGHMRDNPKFWQYLFKRQPRRQS